MVPSVSVDVSELSEIEVLRRQVIALQRISSLGVLAGGVFHELNNALTPILNYAKLGLRNPDPAYRERASDTNRRCGATGGDDHAGHARPVAAWQWRQSPRADRPGAAGRRGDPPDEERHGAGIGLNWT